MIPKLSSCRLPGKAGCSFRSPFLGSMQADSRCLQAGDHVKVNSGQHEGQTGMVVRVEDPICVLVSDSTHEELQVFARDLTESSEAATGLDRCLSHASA